jgi:hypothetical protein
MPPVRNITGGQIQITPYPLRLTEITSWYTSKQRALAGSDVSLATIRERIEFLPAAGADFDGPNTIGRINGWVSGEFDLEVLRVSDGKGIFFEHANVSAVEELETAYANFIRALRTPTTD